MNSHIIKTVELTKTYKDKTVVKNVSLNIKKGRIYGLLGRNGAGKTTIMKMLLGLVPVTSGEIYMFDKNIKGNEKNIYKRIGSIIETPSFYPNLTGTENLEIFAKMHGIHSKKIIENALNFVNLPFNDKKLFKQYSLGMKQRLGIANAILHDPDILILDEPTNGLDPIGIAEMRSFLKKLSNEHNKTILISSHILSEIAQIADDIGIINDGVLIEESTIQELELKNKKYIILIVSEIDKTKQILENEFNIKDYSIKNEKTIHIYKTSLKISDLNRVLVLNNIAVDGIMLYNNTLEDYFKQITGGIGIS